MQEIVLCRHAETTANAEHVLQGRLDFPLTDRGARQALALVPRLCGLDWDVIVRSPSERVLRTLQPALDAGLPEPQVIADLDEIDLGEAAGLSFAEFLRTHGPSIDEQAYARGEYRFPAGESRRDLFERAEQAWRSIEELGGERVLVASHGGLLSQLLAVVLGLDNDGRVRFRLNNAALSKLVWFRGQPFLSRFNDEEHLAAPDRSPVFAPRSFEHLGGAGPSRHPG